MRFVATVAGRRHTIEVDANGHDRHITLDGRELTVDWRLIGARRARSDGDRADHYSVLAGTRSYEAYVRALGEPSDGSEGGARTLEVIVGGRPYAVHVQDARSEALAAVTASAHLSGDMTVHAPMPGLVRNVLVVPGAEVRRGEIVVVLEAMKMENDLTAIRAGTVKSVAVAAGQTVNQGDALVTIGDSPGASAPPDDETDDSPIA